MNIRDLKGLRRAELNGSLKSYKDQWSEHIKVCYNCAGSRVPARDMCDDGLDIRIWVHALDGEIARRDSRSPKTQSELF